MPEPMSGGAIACMCFALALSHILTACIASIVGEQGGKKGVEKKAIAAGLARYEYDTHLDAHVVVFKTREELLREWKEKDDGY